MSDDTFDLAAAIAAAPVLSGPGYPIDLPYGQTLAVGTGVVVDRPVILRGNGCTLLTVEGGTALHFKPQAQRSTVEDLRIEGPGKYKPSLGVRVEAHGLRLRNMHITKAQTAVRMHSGKDYPGVNCNMQKWQDWWVTNCEVGFDINGGDSNAGLFIGVEMQSVDTPFRDSGFLGNTYLCPSSHGAKPTQGAAWQFDELAAYHLILGGYLEGTDNLDVQGSNSLVVGGNAVKALVPTARTERVGHGYAQLQFQRAGGARVRLPGAGLERALEFGFSGSTAWWTLMRWATGKMGLARNGAGSRSPYRWNDEGQYELGEPEPESE